MRKSIDVAIIGTGTAALAAAGEVQRATENFIIASNGIYGTTCVRAGCMPSKAFILATQLFQSRLRMEVRGITGVQGLRIDTSQLMRYVRTMRAHFLEHTLKCTEAFRPHIVEGEVWFLSPTEFRLNEDIYTAKRIILATGSSPIIPDACKEYKGTILTSDTLFEQEALPDTMTVMGMSVLGAEMAQAFARIGMRITASHENSFIGGLTDPQVNSYALRYLRQEMEIRLDEPPEQCLSIKSDALFVAQSRRANIHQMGLEECGIITADAPVIDYNPQTMQVGQLPVFVAGDVKLGRSILNEASDEGKIAGYNASHEAIKSFRRRTPLQITYTAPTIAITGRIWQEIDPESIIIGTALFDDQGRAKLMGEPHGIVRIYADKATQILIGAELFVPDGEHLAHMLAWLIDRRVCLADAVALPFYHPTLEEGLKNALEDALNK